jgi:U3 small nucleolar RNA-associated protein 20
LANPSREAATFALLRAIIVRRLVAPEVYDIIEEVSKMFVRSHKATSRRRCSNVLLQFLLRYPLGADRLQQHLEHFVKNLGYAYADGRLAVLDMLHAIVMKFPRDELNKQVRRCD